MVDDYIHSSKVNRDPCAATHIVGHLACFFHLLLGTLTVLLNHTVWLSYERFFCLCSCHIRIRQNWSGIVSHEEHKNKYKCIKIRVITKLYVLSSKLYRMYLSLLLSLQRNQDAKFPFKFLGLYKHIYKSDLRNILPKFSSNTQTENLELNIPLSLLRESTMSWLRLD